MNPIAETLAPYRSAGHSLGLVGKDSPGVDSDCFDEIFGRHREMVYRVCLRWLGHHHDAEDVTQETFRRAAAAMPNWDNRRPIEPWLVTIAGNRCRTFLSRRAREKVTASLDGLATDFPAIVVDHQVASEQESIAEDWLGHALKRLPRDQRRAFELIHRDDFSYPQAAEEMGRSVGTIKTWVHRARNSIRETWQSESGSRAIAASVASVIILAGWFFTQFAGSPRTPDSSFVASVDDQGTGVVQDTSAVAETILPLIDSPAIDWQLASLQAFTEADLRFDRFETMPQGTIPVDHWIEQSTPVIQQIHQGVAPMERTIRGVMMLFSCRNEPRDADPAQAEFSELT